MKKLKLSILALAACLLIASLAGCKSEALPEETLPIPELPSQSSTVVREEPANPVDDENDEPGDSDVALEEISSSEQSASQAEESSAAESSTADEQSESSTAEATQYIEPGVFNYGTAKVSRMYARNYFGYTYAPIDRDKIADTCLLLMQAGASEVEELYSRNEGGFLVVLDDGTRYSYTLIPTAVRVDNDAYPISQETYNTLLSTANGAIATGPHYIQWLCYMRRDWVAGISIHTDSSDSAVQVRGDQVEYAASILAGLQVRAGTGSTYTDKKSYDKVPGNTIIRVTFDSGIVYSILIESGSLYIESSDMDYGCSYQLLTSHASINETLVALT